MKIITQKYGVKIQSLTSPHIIGGKLWIVSQPDDNVKTFLSRNEAFAHWRTSVRKEKINKIIVPHAISKIENNPGCNVCLVAYTADGKIIYTPLSTVLLAERLGDTALYTYNAKRVMIVDKNGSLSMRVPDSHYWYSITL